MEYIQEQIVKPSGMISVKDLSKNYDSIIKIETDHSQGTGFFMKFNYKGKIMKSIVSNEHVIKRCFRTNPEIDCFNIKFKQREIEREIYFTKDREVFFFYPNFAEDVTIVEIKDFDKIPDDIKYLEADKDFFSKGFESYEGQNVFVLWFPKLGDLNFSSGQIIGKHGDLNYSFIHNSSTLEGQSGSPILFLTTFKVIGVHKGGRSDEKRENEEPKNIGSYIGYIINKINELKTEPEVNEAKKTKSQEQVIQIILEVDEEDVNKEVDFLCRLEDSWSEEVKKKIKKLYEELSDSNIYIDGERFAFKTFHKFNTPGRKQIEIKFNKNLITFNSMFYKCSNIIKLILKK